MKNTTSASPLNSIYPLITTPTPRASRDFFVQYMGFEVGFESSWFVWLSRPSATSGPMSIAFMHTDHPSSPPGPEALNGTGLLLTFEVEDATHEAHRLQQAGVSIIYPLRREPWGQLRFQIQDPSGLVLDVVQQIEPAPGYWEQYAGEVQDTM